MSGGILGLDPSIALFGWAYADPGQQPIYGSVRLAREGADADEVQDALDIFLKARVDTFGPAWMVREQTFDGPNARTNYLLHGMGWQIDLRAKDWGIGCRQAEASAITKFFLGQARFPGKTYAQRRAAKHRALMAMCRMYGWKVTDDNQAVACALLCYAETRLFPEMRLAMHRPAGPLFA